MTEEMKGIEARGLGKSFGGVHVLADVDLVVRAGEVVALLGRNGAGKSTTVRLLATLTRPDAGSVRIAGIDALADPAGARRHLALTAQDSAVDGRLTGRENLRLIARLRHLGRQERRERPARLLDELDLTDAADRRVSTYSGGMRRRLDLAMSLMTPPTVLFLDEPTTGLDPHSRETVWDAVRHLAAQGTAVLLTTQYLQEADVLADRVIVLEAGVIVADGTANELKAQMRGEVARLEIASSQARARAHVILGDRVLATPGADVLDVATDGSAAQIRRLLNELHDAGVGVDRLTLDRPTLDEVFLALTRRDRIAA
jgi:ABC-2 type transport system ATP-binding protein